MRLSEEIVALAKLSCAREQQTEHRVDTGATQTSKHEVTWGGTLSSMIRQSLKKTYVDHHATWLTCNPTGFVLAFCDIRLCLVIMLVAHRCHEQDSIHVTNTTMVAISRGLFPTWTQSKRFTTLQLVWISTNMTHVGNQFFVERLSGLLFVMRMPLKLARGRRRCVN